MFNDYQDIINVDQLCEMLCIGKNSAYTLLASHQIKAYRHNRIWKIPKQGVIQYILEQSRLECN